MSSLVLWVAIFGLLTALATGAGAIPFAFVPQVSRKAIASAGALASGLMLGASFGLVVEGSEHGAIQTVIGAGLGVLFVLGAERYLSGRPQIGFGELRGARARQVLLVLSIMTVHSFAEGVAVGVAFGGGERLALLITAAIAVHNIPEGLAITAVMRPKGSSTLACAGWSIFTSLPQPLMAVPAYLMVERFRELLPFGLGFAAGAMVFLVFVELLPEAYVEARKSTVGILVSLAMGLMILLQEFI